MTVASAPGKIVLCGEYAVLFGAPAVCMAIDRRAHVEVNAAVADLHRVRTRGHIDGEWSFRLDEDRNLNWIGNKPPGGSLDLLQSVLRMIDVGEALDLSIDSTEFFDAATKSKLGLGSSAASTAALVTALCHVTGCNGRVQTRAMAAHRHFQQGKGSGVDIAASLNGSVIEYRMRKPETARTLRWPAGLEYAVLWSGRAASTAERLDKLERASPELRHERSAARLCQASETSLKAWSSGHSADVLTAFRRYIDTLEQFDIDHNLGIFDAGHRELAYAAKGGGMIYKPCGAGGGDVGIALATERQAIADFTGRAEAEGFRALDVSADARGAILDKE